MFSFRTIFKYVWPIVARYRAAFWAILILFSTRVLLDFVVIPLYFQKFIDLISEAPNITSVLENQVFHLVFIIIAIHVVVVITARARGIVHLSFLSRVTRDLRDYAFQKIERNSYTFFSNTFAGSLVTKVRRFVNSFDAIFDIFVFNFIQIAVLFGGIFFVLVQRFPTVSIVLAIFMLLYFATVALFIKKKLKYDLLESAQDSKISGRLADSFGNILAVKFFSAREREIKSFGEYTEEGRRRSDDAFYYNNVIDVIQSVFGFIIHGVVLYILAKFWIEGKISAGSVVLIYTYTTMILIRMWELSNALVKLMKALADMQEVVDIFELKPDILDPENPEELKITKGEVVFKDVDFKYQQGEAVFDKLNLVIKPGERVGLVGHSGAGKSTITKLLLRFSDISGGSITIDGQDIRNVRQDDLRRAISYVPQEPLLFHRPIKENINYGKPEATPEEIVGAARKAHAHEFIDRLEKGYDTLVGERGVKLSGGERQRVVIARAMLKDAPLLILDEATSSLDSVSEAYIQDAFNELMKNKTTIVIAHRLSTIQKMDRIIVLDNGKIKEEGTHQQLLQKGGIYKELWDHQSGGFLE